MSTKPETFPRHTPAISPPPLRGELVNGRPTPMYALAWVCPAEAFFDNLSAGAGEEVDDCNFTTAVSNKWLTCPNFGLALKPLPYPGLDGNFYLIAMFNDREADHFNRVRDLDGDPLIQAARICLGVDQDRDLEQTLKWFRFP